MTARPDPMAAIDPRLASYIATRDRRVAKVTSWSPTRMTAKFAELLKDGRVVVGGRASCGGKVDPTWIEFTAWDEVVRKAKSFGYAITVKSIKHKNGSPTRSGGFWDENEYILESRS